MVGVGVTARVRANNFEEYGRRAWWCAACLRDSYVHLICEYEVKVYSTYSSIDYV